MAPRKRPATEPVRRGRGRPAGSNEARAELIGAAVSLLAEQPSHELTLRTVGERAGYDPMLVKYYFGNKAGLMDAAYSEAANDLARDLAREIESDGDLTHRIHAIVAILCGVVEDKPHFARLATQQLALEENDNADHFWSQFAIPYVTRVIGIVEDGIAAGEIRPTIDPVLLACTLNALPLFLSLLLPRFRVALGNDTSNAGIAPEQLSDLLLYGILAQAPGANGRAGAGKASSRRRPRSAASDPS